MIQAICRIIALIFLAGSIAGFTKPVPENLEFNRYHTPQELNEAVTALNAANPAFTAIHKIGRSPGGRDLLVIEAGPDTANKGKRKPAVFVAANLEGTIPVASEAALFLVTQAIGRAETRSDLTWYILASGNPDGAARFFSAPKSASGRNDSPHNDDMDDAADEDGPDDLDGNGIITQMRVQDPAGEWIPLPADPRLMKRADPAKGEKGLYKLYSEGVDNDGDGEYNEDGPGGTDIVITFPHLFHPFTPTGGDWPGSEPETFAIMQFVMSHPEIAMTLTLGSTNMCLQPPAGGRKSSADLNRIQIPERMARDYLNADPNATYTLQEVMDMVRQVVPPGTEVTEALVSSILRLGAVVNPLEEDLKYYSELSGRYKDFLKQNKLDGKRLPPAQPKDASFELWSYYQLGVHTFSMDFWTLPEAPEETPAGSGPAAPRPEGTPGDASKQIPNPKEAGMDPKMKALLQFSDSTLQGKGFVAWKAFKHPTLGDVDIGGAVPYADTTPPPETIKQLLEGQVPWVFKIAEKLPRMKIAKTSVAAKGANVYELTAWVQNTGALPFPTAMGGRNRQPGPAVITVGGNGLVFFSGKARTTVNGIDAMKSVKLSWLIQCEKPQAVPLRLESANAWSDSVEIQLGGER